MANILVEHNEADNDAQLASNLVPQAIGFSLESNDLGYLRHDTSLGDVLEFVPTLTGTGSNGARVRQPSHGFSVGVLICYSADSRSWVVANPSLGLWASHYVTRVHSASVFDASSAGTFPAPSYVAGNYGTLYLGADGKLTTVSVVGAVQVVAFTNGTQIFLAVENKLNLSIGQKAANFSLAEPVVGDDMSILYGMSQGYLTKVVGFLHGAGTGSVTVMLYKSTSRNAGATGTALLSAPFVVSSKTTVQTLLASYPIPIAPGEFVYAIVTALTGAPTFLNIVATFTGID